MVGWLGTFKDTVVEFRHANLSTKQDWDEFTKPTYTASYRSGDWNVLGSQNIPFLEKANDPLLPFRQEWESDYSMLTAFHSLIEKRLILDGMNRGFWIEKAYREGRQAREVQIFEAKGAQVHVTFWPDFLNLIAGSSLGRA